MSHLTKIALFGLAAVLAIPSLAQAHFLWLVSSDSAGERAVHVYFSETAGLDDPALLERIGQPTIHEVRAEATHELTPQLKDADLVAQPKDADLVAQPKAGDAAALFHLTHTYGVISRGGKTFLLAYSAKTGPALDDPAWKRIQVSEQLPFDLIPSRDGKDVKVRVLWKGKPLSGSEYVVKGPEGKSFDGQTNDAGELSFPVGQPGMYSIRARRVSQEQGEVDGKKYASVRHYGTLALTVGASKAAQANHALPDLPHAITSFGAAVAEKTLYVYGGHRGAAHHYSMEGQSDSFRSLDLANPKEWRDLAGGPKLQGLAMIAHDGRIYRMGGFTAKNHDGDDQDLHSTADFARFDPQTGEWEALPPLPEPRSSFDAVVDGSRIYVAGGWNMQGPDDRKWHSTAWSIDLEKKPLAWEALPEPPFRKRAVALGVQDGRIYVLGGMKEKGGPTTEAHVYDPQTRKWSEAPALVGEGMDGFGSSAFVVDGRLYATTSDGHLQRLSSDGKKWEVVEELDPARFFHRMVAAGDSRLLLIGGANMGEGKYSSVQMIEVDGKKAGDKAE